MAGMSIPPVFPDMYVQNVKCIVSLRKKYNDITTHIVYSLYRVLVSAFRSGQQIGDFDRYLISSIQFLIK